ncbi:MAG: hypothetical protein HY361_03070 [Candidatus Aenigmarchaeota archaeon]|nr:hypothetical protein [Candidatus Aenigmarchaeota archaeon]
MVKIDLGKKILIIILVITLAFVTYEFILIPTETINNIDKSILPQEPNTTKFIKELKEIELTGKRIAVVRVPAVDNQGNGIATTLKVEAIPGEGRTLTNIDQLLFWVDTQYSIQIAKEVAGNLTKADLSKIDLIYTIETEASVIEGPSAGAALTLATIAILENRSVNPNVSITGTINPDGSIGAVGGILAKSKASKDVGIKLFLVPKGQGLQTVYKPVKQCEKIGVVTYCTIEYEKESVDITEQSGVEVKEVANVEEALKYFIE